MSITATFEDGIGRLTLSHPPLNILTRGMMTSLRSELARLQSEPTLRVLVLDAEGKHFSAGADVGEHLPPEFEQMIPEFLETISALHDFPAPVVAAVQGRCLGGGFEMIQVADLVVAGEDAVFGQPEIVLGVLPPAACALLPRLTGPAMAARIAFTGDAITAREALQAGIVAEVVTGDEVGEEAMDLARQIAKHSAAALRATKRALRVGASDIWPRTLERAGEIYVAELMKTHDATEGLQAFLEKRPPVWQHQ